MLQNGDRIFLRQWFKPPFDDKLKIDYIQSKPREIHKTLLK
jgi:hypothetical protein